MGECGFLGHWTARSFQLQILTGRMLVSRQLGATLIMPGLRRGLSPPQSPFQFQSSRSPARNSWHRVNSSPGPQVQGQIQFKRRCSVSFRLRLSRLFLSLSPAFQPLVPQLKNPPCGKPEFDSRSGKIPEKGNRLPTPDLPGESTWTL